MNAHIAALYEWFKNGGKGEYEFRDETRPGVCHTFCAYGKHWQRDFISSEEFVCDNVYYSSDNVEDKQTLWIDIMNNEITIDSTYFNLDTQYSIDPTFFSTEISEEEIFQYMTANDIFFLDADTLKIVVVISKCL